MATRIKETPMVTGKDAANFMIAIKNVKRLPQPEIDKLKANYLKILAKSKL
jgi:hypothetical protein